ncbi:TonB-dependent receptor [Pelagibius sp.]|uniref:TonB-dependent receptor n=1 Tax=Pelagibius sp. TaxID=1931238 RepID=UPI003BB140A6
MQLARIDCPAGKTFGPNAVTVAVAFVASTVSCGTALGQEEKKPLQLDTITVTARKLEEPVQRIPFGISVFDSKSIDQQGIRDARSFARSVPGYNYIDTGVRGSNTPNIRGVGSFFPQSADDGSVPVFIDGVPVPLRAQDREFFDLERIEILRGPQNTLYGRNAQAGAVNITTADPTFEPLFEIGGEIGNFDFGRVTALASGPLSEDLAGRIAVQLDTRDGDIRDLNSGETVRDQDLLNVHGKFVWFPDDATDATLALRYGNYNEEPAGAWFEDPDFPQVFFDSAPSYDLETLGGGLTVRRDFEAMTLTSVTGLQYYTSDFFSDDTDGLVFSARTGASPFLFNNPDADFREIRDENIQLSQEFRLDGELESGLRWLAGVNLFRSDFEIDFTSNSTAFIFGEFDNRHITTSYAGFGEVTVPLTESLRAIAGLRYTHEQKDFDGRFTDRSGGTLGADSSEDADESFDLVTGRAAITYDFLPTLTGFASVSRGAKAGGFQLADFDARNGAATDEFDAAYTWSYEAGLRGTLLDGMLDVSASVFFNDTEGEHVQVTVPVTFESVIENIDTETYGIELATAVRPLEGLTLSGGLALLQTEIVESDDPTVAAGNEIPFAPEVSFDLAAQYERPLDLFSFEGDVFGRAEYQYVGTRTVDPQNRFDLGAFDIVNLRAGWGSERVSIYGFVTNLFDEEYAETAFSFGASLAGERVSVGVPGQPRRFGIGAKIRF